MKTIVRLLKWVFSSPANRDIGGTSPRLDLQAALAAERSRSDRSGRPFTFVVINLERRSNGALNRERATQLLEEAVQARTRSTDTKAWQGEDLAVILPYTTAQDVDHLLQSIEKIYTERARQEVPSPSSVPGITFDVYSHPEKVEEKAE